MHTSVQTSKFQGIPPATPLRLRRDRRSSAGTILILLLCAALGACGWFGNYSEAELLLRAKNYYGTGQLESAAVELKSLLQDFPNNKDARYLLGEVNVSLGYGAAAEMELKRAVDLGMVRETVQVAMGRALLLQYRYERALAETRIPDNASEAYTARILEIQGRAQLGLGHYREGCDLFKRSLEKDKSYVRGYWGLALCAVGNKNFNEGRTQLEKALAIDPKDSDTWSQIGDLERLKLRFVEADSAYGSALKYKPRNLDALLGRATARVMDNRLEDGEKDIDAALKIFRGHPVAIHLRGIIQFKRGKFADARSSFERVIKTGAEYPLSVLWLGLTQFVQGNFEESSRSLVQFVRTRPTNPVPVYALLTYIDARLSGRQLTQARLKLLRTIDIDDPQALTFIGGAYMVLGQGELAIEYLQRVVGVKKAVGPYINLATAYLLKGEKAKAIEALEQAVGLKPAAAQEGAVERAVRLQPEAATEADELLVLVLADDKQYDRALKAVEALQAKVPKSPTPHNLRGRIKLARNDEEGARAEFALAMELRPGDVTAGNALAQLAARKKDYQAARDYYGKVLKANKDDLATLLALYQLENATNRAEDALRVLEKALAAHPAASGPALLLGERYLKSGRALKVLETTRAAAAASPGDPALLEMRGAAYMALADTSNALVAYKQLAKVRPESADAMYYVATAQAARKDMAAYRAALTDALKLDPRHFRAKGALARIELQEGRRDAALKISRELGKEYPDAVDGPQLAAEALMAKGDTAAAVAALDSFQRAHQGDWRARELLVKTHLYLGDSEKALRISRDGRSAYSDRAEAADLLGQTQLRLGDRAGALATYNEFLTRHPNSASMHVAAGLVHIGLADFAAARVAMRKALELQSDNLDAQRALASIEAREKRYDEALDIARRVQKQRPSSSAGYVLEGDLRAAQKDFSKAVRAYENAAAAELSALIVMKLHGALMATGSEVDADRRVLDWLRDRPQDNVMRNYLAESYLRRGKNMNAIDQYQLIVKIDGKDVLAMNNLANLYQLGRDPRALELAERAYRLKPDNADVLDTLGWLLVQKGTLARGLDLLRQARKLAPDNPGVTYHYAAAVARSGDKASARNELQTLIRSGKDFPEKREAQSLLIILQG